MKSSPNINDWNKCRHLAFMEEYNSHPIRFQYSRNFELSSCASVFLFSVFFNFRLLLSFHFLDLFLPLGPLLLLHSIEAKIIEIFQ